MDETTFQALVDQGKTALGFSWTYWGVKIEPEGEGYKLTYTELDADLEPTGTTQEWSS
jgi:hypothetical protein